MREPGAVVAEAATGHAVRIAARALVAALFDAWDAGDADGVTSCFAPEATFTDATGTTVVGLPAIRERYTRWRAWAPFSMHWTTNEAVLADGATTDATWLWSSAATVPALGGAVWAGGDLSFAVARSEGGWRLTELTWTDRYRTPYRAGWLECPMVEIDLPVSSRTPGTPAGLPGRLPLPSFVETDELTQLLAAERHVRRLVGAFGAALDSPESAADAPLDEFVRLLAPMVVLRDDGVEAEGSAAVQAALVAERAHAPAPIRATTSVVVAVGTDGRSAVCRWRDLATAVVDGSARWRAHAWSAAAASTPTGWRLEQLERVRVLDATYDQGWT